MHEGEGFGAVAVDADGIDLQGYGAAVVGLYGTLRGHLQNPRNGGILVLDHCAGSAAWHKAAASTGSLAAMLYSAPWGLTWCSGTPAASQNI